MRRNLLFVFCLLSLNMMAQNITFTPNPAILEISDSDLDVKIDIDIQNTIERDIEFWWSIDRGTTPDEWQFYLCDMNLCYTPSVTSCPCSKENLLSGNGTGVLMLHIVPNGVAGSGVVTLNILEECDGDVNIVDIPVEFEVSETTSSEFAEIDNNISIYPNPAYDRLSIKDDTNVSSVALFNIVGKRIRTFNHIPGMSHDVSDLDKGIYLVRLLNDEQNILKALRLTKK